MKSVNEMHLFTKVEYNAVKISYVGVIVLTYCVKHCNLYDNHRNVIFFFDCINT